MHFNWCLTCNQMRIFLYPARVKGGGLSSFDQKFRGTIAPIYPRIAPRGSTALGSHLMCVCNGWSTGNVSGKLQFSLVTRTHAREADKNGPAMAWPALVPLQITDVLHTNKWAAIHSTGLLMGILTWKTYSRKESVLIWGDVDWTASPSLNFIIS